MFFRQILLGICLLHCFHVSSCGDPTGDMCEDPPVFSPSHLVVRHGDPTSATCTVCKENCRNTLIGLEKSLGTTSTNGTIITWKVAKLTEWDTSALCYYNYNSKQCYTVLPVTVYHPPVQVSLRFVNYSGPLIVNRTYTVQCTVEDVAPVKSLIVSFYKGDTLLAQSKFDGKDKKPVTKTVTHDINPSREDNGAQYWCEARLDLGPGGPEHPPVVASKNITSIVHYMPYQDRPTHSDQVIVTNGYPFQLNCSAMGNPSPTYHWTFPSSVPHVFNGSDFTVNSATFEHGGQYICTIFNDIGLLQVTFNVQVQVNYIPIIIGVVVGIVVFAVLICIVLYLQYYKQYRTGHYKVMGVNLFRSQHTEVPLKA